MIREIFIATGNKGKLREFTRLLGGRFQIKGNHDYPGMIMPEEDGMTFKENAAIKALAAAGHSGTLAMADDSGLVVDALGGEPGVRTARYGGDAIKDDTERLELLLKNMQSVPEIARSARFVCAVALARPGKIMAVTEGICEGRIAFGPKGTNGFGYDPVFLPEGHDKSFAELTGHEKDGLSHRSKALCAMVPILETLMAGEDKGL